VDNSRISGYSAGGNKIASVSVSQCEDVSRAGRVEQRGAVESFWSTAPIPERVEYADRIQSSIRLPCQPFNIILVVPAVVISAVGDDQPGSFIVSSGMHFAAAAIDRIKKLGRPFPEAESRRLS
jgi:hypothetical protein